MSHLCFINATVESKVITTIWKKFHIFMKSGRLSKVIKASGISQ